MFKLGDHVLYVGPNKDWLAAHVSGVIIDFLKDNDGTPYARIVDDKTGEREKYANLDRWVLLQANEPAPARKTELWWQRQDREQRELRSMNAALHMEIRQITGVE